MIFQETLKPSTEKLINILEIPDNFYLAGGTALALQIGHRQSEDLDFFTPTNFNTISVEGNIRKNHHLENVQVIGDSTLLGICDEVKINFMKFDYPFLEEPSNYKNIKLASILDIACMKLNAISRRNTKKDFIDIFYILKNFYNLKTLFEKTQEKFKEINMAHVIFSLTYFEEANTDPDVIWMNEFRKDWNEIKIFFNEEVSRYSHESIFQ